MTTQAPPRERGQPRTADFADWTSAETVETRFGSFEFMNGHPTAAATERLHELRTFNSAVECYLSQVLAVSMFHFRDGFEEMGADAANKVVISETLVDAASMFLTSNTETVYGSNFLDLGRDGPTVVEAPPRIYGGTVDMWTRSIEEIGPAGPDQGKGGKYLFLPPDYRGPVPGGYFVVKSPTFGIWLAVCGFLVDGKLDLALALMRSVKIYPLALASTPPAMAYINMSDDPYDRVLPDDYTFFESLSALVDQEPADAIPAADRFLLASMGIQKGQSFRPDVNTKMLLTEAACVGAAMARIDSLASRDPARVVYSDRRWELAFLRAGRRDELDRDGGRPARDPLSAGRALDARVLQPIVDERRFRADTPSVAGAGATIQ